MEKQMYYERLTSERVNFLDRTSTLIYNEFQRQKNEIEILTKQGIEISKEKKMKYLKQT